ncbi:MAG: thiamine phosphate synthase [Planctomycetota bacterium]|nr:thiamine phosphate synthase [Planctomycetota bacterium]
MIEPNLVRLLDANANRAREGLRSAEDYARFIVGTGRWYGRLKQARHRLTELLTAHPGNEVWAAARRVQSDLGNPEQVETLPAPGGGEPTREVALRGLKRAQEALRALEEYTRAGFGELSRDLSKLRYGAYEAEQWLVQGSDRSRALNRAKLYVLLCEEDCALGLEGTARAALEGGAEILQLREKRLEGAAILERARRLREVCAERGALLVVNDRVDVALAAEADGAHLGQKDLPPADARRQTGPGVLLGRSTHTLEQARRALEEDVDYLAVGAMYATETKAGYTLAGPGLAREVAALGADRPVFAIGGITAARAAELKRAGIGRVAVGKAVCAAKDPCAAAAALRAALEQ